MSWHFEVTAGTLRRYKEGDGFEERSKSQTVAHMQLIGGSQAYISGMANVQGSTKLSRKDREDLRSMLKDQLGIKMVKSERRGKPRDFDTRPSAKK